MHFSKRYKTKPNSPASGICKKVDMESLFKKKLLNITNENHRVPRNSNLANVDQFKSDAH
jgi:hypothetical protein